MCYDTTREMSESIESVTTPHGKCRNESSVLRKDTENDGMNRHCHDITRKMPESIEFVTASHGKCRNQSSLSRHQTENVGTNRVCYDTTRNQSDVTRPDKGWSVLRRIRLPTFPVTTEGMLVLTLVLRHQCFLWTPLASPLSVLSAKRLVPGVWVDKEKWSFKALAAKAIFRSKCLRCSPLAFRQIIIARSFLTGLQNTKAPWKCPTMAILRARNPGLAPSKTAQNFNNRQVCRVLTFDPFTPDSATSKIDKFSENYKLTLKNKQHHSIAQLNNFPTNGNTFRKRCVSQAFTLGVK